MLHILPCLSYRPPPMNLIIMGQSITSRQNIHVNEVNISSSFDTTQQAAHTASKYQVSKNMKVFLGGI